jgi:hypothetical protein
VNDRKSLTDILNGNSGWFNNDNWDDIPPAPDFGTPIPPGNYVAHLKDAEPFQAKTGTAGIKLHFEVVEGDCKGRRAWYDIWITEAAKRQAVRDFNKLGVKNRRQLEGPLPRWIRCSIHVVINTDDKGNQYNRVRSFDVLGVDSEPAEPFAPADASKGGPSI